MRKLTIIALFMVLIFVLIGCGEITTTENQTTNAPTSTTDNLTTQSTNVFGVENETIDSIEDISSKIDFYQQKLFAFVGEVQVEATSTSNSLSVIQLEEGEPVFYDREELPRGEVPIFTQERFDTEFILPMMEVLSGVNEALENCAEFQENDFCTILGEDANYKIKVLNEGDKLYIEAYIYQYTEEYDLVFSSVSASIMYFDMVNDELVFEHVRDYQTHFRGELRHTVYYDRFSQNGGVINVEFDGFNHENIYYQKYDASTNDVFLVTNSEEGYGINYKDAGTDTFYGITLNPNQEIDSLRIFYGTFDPVLGYSSYGTFGYLNWNIFEIDGWNRVSVSEYEADHLYYNDTLLLDGFDLNIEIQEGDTDARLRLAIDPSELSAGIVSLSDYGLSFQMISYEQLLSDIAYFTDNYETVLIEQGFPESLEERYSYLYQMVPVFADEEIVLELFTWIDEQIALEE